LNDYTAAERSGWQAAANMKKRCENIVIHSARSLGDVQIYDRVYMTYTWYEPNQRRDLDNISSFGRKVIQDALVKSKILQNDGWKNISGFQDRFFVDKKNPRIVVEIEELE
jgi:Holliday junction resolvase RusA-like endonuclease